jgi:hypothetical protein
VFAFLRQTGRLARLPAGRICDWRPQPLPIGGRDPLECGKAALGDFFPSSRGIAHADGAASVALRADEGSHLAGGLAVEEKHSDPVWLYSRTGHERRPRLARLIEQRQKGLFGWQCRSNDARTPLDIADDQAARVQLLP